MGLLLFVVEIWLDVTNCYRSMYLELGIDQKVAEWFEAAEIDDLSLFRREYLSGAQMNAILGRLVSLGVPKVGELELRVQVSSQIASR